MERGTGVGDYWDSGAQASGSGARAPVLAWPCPAACSPAHGHHHTLKLQTPSAAPVPTQAWPHTEKGGSVSRSFSLVTSSRPHRILTLKLGQPGTSFLQSRDSSEEEDTGH